MSADIQDKETKPITRRNILKIAFVALVSALVPPAILTRSESLEKLPSPSRDVVYIDANAGILVRDRVVKRLVGEGAKSQAQIFDQFGPDVLDPNNTAIQKDIALNPEYRKSAIVHALMMQWDEHAQLTSDVFVQTAKEASWDVQKPDVLPLDEALQDYEFETDDIGNFDVSAQINADTIIALLKGTEHKSIVNMSVQVGTVRAKLDLFSLENLPSGIDVNNDGTFYYPAGDYDQIGGRNENGKIVPIASLQGVPVPMVTEAEIRANPTKYLDIVTNETLKYRIYEPFNPEVGEETFRHNIDELIRICNALPDTLFSVAAGTFDCDISAIRAEYEAAGTWPSNLIMVGAHFGKSYYFAENKDSETGGTGADIFIVTQEFTTEDSTPWSSSVSTSIVTSVLALLHTQYPDYTAQQLKALLIQEYCVPITYEGKGGKVLQGFKLDAQKYKTLTPQARSESPTAPLQPAQRSGGLFGRLREFSGRKTQANERLQKAA